MKTSPVEQDEFSEVSRYCPEVEKGRSGSGKKRIKRKAEIK